MDTKKIDLSALRRYPIALICGVVILICAALLYLRGNRVSGLKIQNEDLESEVSLLERNDRNSKKIDEQNKQIEEVLSEVEARLFDADQKSANINFFYNLEEEVAITKLSQSIQVPAIFAAGGTSTLSTYKPIQYDIEIKGTYAEILRFIQHLDSIKPITRVIKAKIKESDRALDIDELQASVQFIVLGEK